METLISNSLPLRFSSRFATPNFLFRLSSLSRKNHKFLELSHCKWLYTPKTATFCTATSSGSLSYGGWDSSVLGGDSVHSGESNQLRDFLNSTGINDKRYIFVYLLGFVCALAISRVRVSSIIVLPACVIIFAVGFSIGFVNGGHASESNLIGSKKKSKFDNIGIAIDKLRNLMNLLGGFDGEIEKLNNDIRRCIQTNQITVADLESYIKATEAIGLSALDAKAIVQGCVDNMLTETQEVDRTSKQNLSKRKKETDGTRFDLSQFIAGLFQKNSISSKPNKMKGLGKRESTDMEVNDHIGGNILTPVVDGKNASTSSDDNVVPAYAGLSGDSPARIEGRVKQLIDETKKIKAITNSEKTKTEDMNGRAGRFSDSRDYSFKNNRLGINGNGQIPPKTDRQNSVEAWTSNNDRLDLDFNIRLKSMRTEASFVQAQEFKKFNENYKPPASTYNNSEESFGSRVREKAITDDDRSRTDHQSAHETYFDSSQSSKVSDDMLFNRYLMEANVLLKDARESLTQRVNEGDAENALNKSAILLSKAIDMKPMSLLAVGQLGNTYLLHGELKLKVSRDLRALLVRNDPSLLEKSRYFKGLDDHVAIKKEVASVLVDVCEECEDLLVKAGRKYRSALSIDGNDMRALYNWGLALSFRAQLIADIGPKAAVDADKVFLAAIDKFDAMMSKSNAHAPDALFRWGLALQQRSRLRTRNSKEKVKLLHQAKRLYEDALHMDSDNLQLREALESCVSEMNYRNY